MEEIVINSKKLALEKRTHIIHFPWRDKILKRRLHWTEFANPKLKKIVLKNTSKDAKDKGKGDRSEHGKGKGKGKRRRNDQQEEQNTYYKLI